ncbi:hypothetical protein QF046_002820 [Microbacterium sp. W4I4]|uniref:2'-5' RNA ligase family protein n=1 Tax=Microbacterium sp. W4I4 TaxID=3042295 RepID=UPI00277D879E|nr:2'-5' RNA ligase family protein [Microbacterium sp. W4I4]MDQ0615179.1 hypothetical protein [Microbacterium sp. W4I4]
MAHAAELSNALRTTPGIAVQPLEYVHLTVQRLESYADEFSDTDFAYALTRIGEALTRTPAFELSFAPAAVRERAIEATSAESAGWGELVRVIRDVSRASGLADEVPSPQHAPHYSLAYCVSETSDGSADKVLSEMARSTTCSVKEVSLVAVDQRPDLGIFTFETIERWTLVGSPAART